MVNWVEKVTFPSRISVSVPTLKKVKIHVEGMHSTRLKEEKSKTKKPVGKGKTSLKNDLDKVSENINDTSET